MMNDDKKKSATNKLTSLKIIKFPLDAAAEIFCLHTAHFKRETKNYVDT